MNRRKAIRNLILATGATVAGVSGYKWYSINKQPDIASLGNYRTLLAELAETIIPRTDTPGAKDAKVGEFIYKMITDCADKRTQNKFLAGLHELESHCQSNYGHSFTACTPAQREETLLHFEHKDKPYGGIIGKVQHKFLGSSFSETLKTYTVMGYCSSMDGATKGLAYDYIPSTYEACIPLKPGQRSWATK